MFAMLGDGLSEAFVELGFEQELPLLVTRQPAWIETLTAPGHDAEIAD